MVLTPDDPVSTPDVEASGEYIGSIDELAQLLGVSSRVVASNLKRAGIVRDSVRGWPLDPLLQFRARLPRRSRTAGAPSDLEERLFVARARERELLAQRQRIRADIREGLRGDLQEYSENERERILVARRRLLDLKRALLPVLVGAGEGAAKLAIGTAIDRIEETYRE